MVEDLSINQRELDDLLLGQNEKSNSKAYAMAYAGHQFGVWAGRLGDGRVVNLGELNYKNQLHTFQVKGAGPTPYSRRGDGFAVLRSSIREHLCSEAMHHLGIPTTRSVTLALSGEEVLRDKLYNGNAAYEPGALVTRMSPSFLRFGSFELLAAAGDVDTMRDLADYVIENYYPVCKSTQAYDYAGWFDAVCQRTLEMLIHWQRVGFVHGVMNTDNMSILGLTIDYGPYGFLEKFDLDWTPNTSDREARYAYGKQGEIALWNLWKLASAIYPLIEDSKPLEQSLEKFKADYEQAYLKMMSDKLGLSKPDENLVYGMIAALDQQAVDFTIFFRQLANVTPDQTLKEAIETISSSFYQPTALKQDKSDKLKSWLKDYQIQLQEEMAEFSKDSTTSGDSRNYAFAKARKEKMNRTNPKYVLRNYMAQMAIEAAEKGDHDLIDELYQMLQRPYDEQPEREKWYAKRPEWATQSQDCTQLSCSS